MNHVISRIDISTPTGRRLLKELEKHKKTVTVEYPLPEALCGQKCYTVEEVFSEIEKDLNEHYGTNFKLKY